MLQYIGTSRTMCMPRTNGNMSSPLQSPQIVAFPGLFFVYLHTVLLRILLSCSASLLSYSAPYLAVPNHYSHDTSPVKVYAITLLYSTKLYTLRKVFYKPLLYSGMPNAKTMPYNM